MHHLIFLDFKNIMIWINNLNLILNTPTINYGSMVQLAIPILLVALVVKGVKSL